jgi:hypothetical protein
VILFKGSGHGVLCANDGVQESLGRCPNIAQLLARAFRCAVLGGLEKNKNTQPPLHLTAVTSKKFHPNF